jgi:hypothetical protein
LPQPQKKAKAKGSHLLLASFCVCALIDLFYGVFGAYRITTTIQQGARGVQKHENKRQKHLFFFKSIWVHHKNVAFFFSVCSFFFSLGCFAFARYICLSRFFGVS